MIAYQPSSGERVRVPGLAHEELQRRYQAYRRRQAAQLLQLMPREAVRPMVRAARAAGVDVRSENDPLAVLASFCESILPLPPYDVWREDLEQNPDAHLRDLDDAREAPTAQTPSTMEVRVIDFGGGPWWAHLRSFRDDSGWRGFIAFEDPSSGRVHRTATIFHEDDPSELRERFNCFENASLEAFLRSALP